MTSSSNRPRRGWIKWLVLAGIVAALLTLLIRLADYLL